MSRLKSARGAKAKTPAAPKAARAARSAPAGARGVYVQSPKSDVYVVMLGIALAAILLGCLLLGLVWNRYDFGGPPTASVSSGAALALFSENSENLVSVRL